MPIAIVDGHRKPQWIVLKHFTFIALLAQKHLQLQAESGSGKKEGPTWISTAEFRDQLSS